MSADAPQPAPVAAASDLRLYVPVNDGWNVIVERGWEKKHCFHKLPGQDYFHRIQHGEIFLQRGDGDELLCLNCAYRLGLLTHDRLHWQRSQRSSLIVSAAESEGTGPPLQIETASPGDGEAPSP